jgi:hypothetical protein
MAVAAHRALQLNGGLAASTRASQGEQRRQLFEDGVVPAENSVGVPLKGAYRCAVTTDRPAKGTNHSQLDALLKNGIGHVSALGLIGHKTPETLAIAGILSRVSVTR